MISLNINQKTYQVDVEPNMPFVMAIRNVIGLTEQNMAAGISANAAPLPSFEW